MDGEYIVLPEEVVPPYSTQIGEGERQRVVEYYCSLSEDKYRADISMIVRLLGTRELVDEKRFAELITEYVGKMRKVNIIT